MRDAGVITYIYACGCEPAGQFMTMIAISENVTAMMIHDDEKYGRDPFPEGRKGSLGCSEP